MAQLLTSADFKEKVIEADKPVLVDFFATWCGPCKMLAPVIDEIEKELAGKAYVYEVDIDQSLDIAAAFRVNSVPTIIAFKDGSVSNMTVGVQPKENLLALLQ